MSRRLGQHFLTRQSILEGIAAAAAPELEPVVVEIGPGKGALTSRLLPRCERLIAVEVDQVLVHYLAQKFRSDARLSVIQGDVLRTDLAQWGPVTIAGNLPYYITSPILDKTLSLGPLLRRAVFLVQKEVAARITTGPGSRDYGYLSVQTQLLSVPELLFDVPPAAFHPPPKVDSSVIRLTPRLDVAVADPDEFLKFVGLCFRQKRKTLRNNLAATYDLALLDSLPQAKLRAEQLSIADFIEFRQRILKG